MSRTARMYLAATRSSKLQKLNKDWPDADALADSYDLYDISSGASIRFNETEELLEDRDEIDAIGNLQQDAANAEMMWKPSSPGSMKIDCWCLVNEI